MTLQEDPDNPENRTYSYSGAYAADMMAYPYQLKTMNMTLQEAKDQIARDYGYENWFYVDLSKESEEVMRDKVAELYAITRLRESNKDHAQEINQYSTALTKAQRRTKRAEDECTELLLKLTDARNEVAKLKKLLDDVAKAIKE